MTQESVTHPLVPIVPMGTHTKPQQQESNKNRSDDPHTLPHEGMSKSIPMRSMGTSQEPKSRVMKVVTQSVTS